MPEGTGRVKACTQCRQQKVRCDAQRDYSQPCSRCQQMGLECKISGTFQRTKRQTKADLRREVAQLKGQVQRQSVETDYDGNYSGAVPGSSSGWDFHNIALPLTAGSVMDLGTAFPNIMNQTTTSLEQLSSPQNMLSVDSTNTQTQDPIDTSRQLHGPQSESLSSLTPTHNYSILSGGSPTSSQTLGEIEIDGDKIAECFSLFYQHYAPLFPELFDCTIPPDEHYRLSTLLFWTIVCTGARKYSRDPTVFDQLSKPINNLAASSLCFNSRPVAVIQAVILLCSWPMPLNTLFKDPSHALAGAALQLAVQNGLHMLCQEGDFASKPTNRNPQVGPHLDRKGRIYDRQQSLDADKEISFRTSLWTNSLIVFQSTSLCDGLPPMSIPESESWHQAINDMLTPHLAYKYKLHRMQTDAVAAIRRSVDLESPEPGNHLATLIDIFDSQILDVNTAGVDAIGLLFRSCTRLLLKSLYFFQGLKERNPHSFLQLYSVASEVILQASSLDGAQKFATYMPHYFARMITLAAYCILRICKTHLAQSIDLEDAGEMVFKAIQLSKNRSVQNHDLDALNGIMITKLWSSKTMFLEPDGTKTGLQLDLRGRLSMSVVFDCFWWWRHEFGGLYDDSIRSSHEDNANVPTRSLNQHPLTTVSENYDSTFANIGSDEASNALQPIYFSPYPDWDWTATLPALDAQLFAVPAS